MGTAITAINVNNHDLSVKEFNGQLVVTLSDIDTVHDREIGTAKKNFQYNKKHFM